MKRTLRLAICSAVALGGLATAGNAFATQRIAVSQTSTSLTIKVSQDQSDQQPAKITIYVPSNYTLSPTPAPGTKIGTTTGDVFASDLGVPVPLTGDVITDDPAKHTKDACSPGNNAAVWILNLQVAGQTIALPVYLNPTSGAAAALGQATLVVCLGPSDVPKGTPGRSPNGAQLLDAVFTVNNMITPVGDTATWISFWTPYASGTGVPNAAGTVEARSFVGSGTVTLKAKVLSKKKKLVRFSGTVKQAGAGVQGAKVTLFINSHARFSTRSNASGGFVFSLQNTRKKVTTTFFQAVAAAAARDITATGCANPTAPPIPCVSATAGPFTARSPKIKVRI